MAPECCSCWRNRDIRFQLITLYGLTGALLSACLVGIVAFGVFHVKSTVVDTSSEKLLEQVLSIQQLQMTEAGEVFTGKMDLGLSTFVLPFAHVLWESHQPDFPLVGGPTFWDYPDTVQGGSLTKIPRYGENDVRLDAGTTFWSGMPVSPDSSELSALSSRLHDHVAPTNHMATVFQANFLSETNLDWIGTFYTTSQPASTYTSVGDPDPRPLLMKAYPGRVLAPRCDCGTAELHADDTLGATNPNCMLASGCGSETSHMQDLLLNEGLTGSACATLGSPSFPTSNAACRAFESRSLDATTRPWYADIYRPTAATAMRWGPDLDGPIASVTTSTSTAGYRPGYSAPHRWVTSGMPFTISIGLTAMLPGSSGSNLEPLGTIHTDLSIPAVQQFVDISARKTGKAHLFHTTSNKIVASKMWDLERDTEYSSSDGLDWERVKGGVDVDNIKIIGPEEYDPENGYETLQDVPTFAEARIQERIANWEQDEEWETMGLDGGSFTVGDGRYEVVYARVGSNRDFITCAVTRKSEILQSIADQTEEIDESADELFVAVLIGVAAIGSLIVVVAVLLAMRISAPLVRVGNTAEKMAGNIGDDLLKGVSGGGGGDGCGPKIKEMQDLKCAFEGLVNERKRLKETQQQAGTQHPPNPFFSVGICGSLFSSADAASATSPPAPWQTQPLSTDAEREPPTAPTEGVPPMATGEKTTLVDQEQPEPETPSVRSGCPLKVWM